MLVIDQGAPAIGINQSPATLRINSNRLRMRVTQENPEMRVEGDDVPRFRVNRARLNDEMGLSQPSEFSARKVQEGRAGAARATRRAVQDGRVLGEITNLTDGVPRLARMRTLEAIQANAAFDLGHMPINRAEFEWDNNQTRVNWTNSTFIIDWEGEHMPTLTIDPRHSIEIYLRTAPYFRVLVSEGEDAAVSGRLVDTTI